MKDSHYDGARESRTWWKHPRFWATSKGINVPMEIKALSDIRGRHESEYVVKILNWTMSEDRLMFRYYMKYAPHGDLYSLKEAHRSFRQYPPEPLLWHFSECLTKVGLLFERGELGHNPMSD